MTEPEYDVCAAVVSDLDFDARVWKEVGSLQGAGYSVLLIGMAYEIDAVERIEMRGTPVIRIPFGSRGNVSRRGRARSLLRFWRAILAADARVYHCHNIHPLPGMWLAARRRRAALVYDAHELYGEIPPGGSRALGLLPHAERAAERFAMRTAAATITTNELRARELQRRHGGAAPLVLANVPRRVDPLEPLDPGFPPGAKVLLYQGGIYASQRAFAETIAALRLLDDVHLVVMGFGRESEIELLRRWAGELGVGDRVHVLGPRPFEELVRTASLATVGLVPIRAYNLNTRLADTNKLFEYLMAGLPVAASALPEIERVIASGEPAVGETFDPSSPESIAAAVGAIVADPVGYDARRVEARRLALERFNWEREERALLELYAGFASER